MEKTDKPLTREALVSMQVIDAKGRIVGKVKDLAFSVGKNGIALTVENEAGEIQTVAWEDVQAAADFVILKPVAQSTYQQPAYQQPVQTAAQPTSSSAAVDATDVSNMRQTLDMDSAIPKMVLLQRQKIRLKSILNLIFFLSSNNQTKECRT